MDSANKKQDDENAGLSMGQLMEKKRIATEQMIKEKMGGAISGKMKASEQEVAERKAKLLAQRDLLRKMKEQKYQEELTDFNSKTETKGDLFGELSKMDKEMKVKQEEEKKNLDNKRKMDIMRKARQDAENDRKEENVDKYNKRVEQIKAKDQKKEDSDDDPWGQINAVGQD